MCFHRFLHQALTMLQLACLAALLAAATACPFRYSDLPLPANHARHLLQPSWPDPPDMISDPTNSAVQFRGGVTNMSSFYQTLLSNGLPDYPTRISSLNAFATAVGQDLCYWSMQQLPAPYNPGADGPNTILDADYYDVRRLGDQATSRFVSLVTSNGPAVWAGCGAGYKVVQKGCALGNITGSLCSSSTLAAFSTTNQAWPVASVIMRYKPGGNNQASDNLMYTWRTTQGGHVPAMSSNLIATGWGYDPTGILAKVVPCAALPQSLFTLPMDPTCNPNITGFVQHLKEWKALCNIFYDSMYGPYSYGSTFSPNCTPWSAPPPPSPQPPSPSPPPPPTVSEASGRARAMSIVLSVFLLICNVFF